MKTGPVILLAFALLVVGLIFLRGIERNSNSSPIVSVDNNAPRGLKGLGLFLRQQGRDIEADRTLPLPSHDALRGSTVVAVPPEFESWNAEEAAHIARFVDDGGDLVVLCDDDDERSERLAALLAPYGAECLT